MMTLIDMADRAWSFYRRTVWWRFNRGYPGRPVRQTAIVFQYQRVQLDKANLDAQIDSILKENKNGQSLILCGLKKDLLLSLTLRDAESVRSMFPAFHSDIYQKLDVSIVDHVILEELLGITQEQMGSFLNWVHDPALAVEKVLAVNAS